MQAWREDGPSQSDTAVEAGLGAQAAQIGLIVLDRTAGARGEDAIQRLVGQADIAGRPPASEVKQADLGIGKSGRARSECHRSEYCAERRGSDCAASGKFH